MIHRTTRFTASGATMKTPTTTAMIIPSLNGVSFFFCALALRFPYVGHKPATSQPMRTEMAKRWQTKDAMVLPLMFPMLQRPLELENCANATSYCSWYIRAYADISRLWTKILMRAKIRIPSVIFWVMSSEKIGFIGYYRLLKVQGSQVQVYSQATVRIASMDADAEQNELIGVPWVIATYLQ
ncbi:Secondary metabolism regulator LAE1 [Fusarium oxysporum f. sp. albedinis]|nr:Secondary metabolism regulator LAE1 [Fusarium oxysporum f. sp. albedinis]